MTTPYKPKLLVDFDGVIHYYRKGWHDGTPYDVPIPGAKHALAQLTAQGYEVVIFSTRDFQQIVDWLILYGFPPYRVTNIKEPALAIIDDRAIHFKSWFETMEIITKSFDI